MPTTILLCLESARLLGELIRRIQPNEGYRGCAYQQQCADLIPIAFARLQRRRCSYDLAIQDMYAHN